MERRRTTTGLGAALAALLAAATAAGQPARDPAMAEALFGRAKALLDQGDWPAACAKFQASMELDPAVSTALKIARCHEHEGKIALAWSDAQGALKLNAASGQPEARRRDLAAYAEKFLADLAPRVPRIRVRIAEAPPGLRITYDGKPLPAPALGEPLPIDPGPHTITAEAEGYLAITRSVTLSEGQMLDVDLALTARPAPIAAPSPPLAPIAPAPTPATATLPSRGSPRRAAGIGVAALGVATLGAAGMLGLLTRGKVHDAAPYCAADFSSCHAMQGIRDLESARTLQTAAFVLLGAGIAGVGTGAALFFTAPRSGADASAAPAITASAGPLGLSVRGSW